MAHCMKFQQTHDTWLLSPKSSCTAHSRYIAKSPATLDERGCTLQMHDVSGRATEPKLRHGMKFREHVRTMGARTKIRSQTQTPKMRMHDVCKHFQASDDARNKGNYSI